MTARHTYRDILERLAPCGMDCERCVRYEHGRIRRLAAELAAALEGFETMAPRVADHAPALQEYGRFVEVLDFLAGGDCAGCRAGGSQLPFCATRNCFREMGVDFCFECSEYPCERNNYPENLDRRWRERNDRMRQVGVEQSYLESLEEPRY
jgi:Protein of unknown function (DUF3795)